MTHEERFEADNEQARKQGEEADRRIQAAYGGAPIPPVKPILGYVIRLRTLPNGLGAFLKRPDGVRCVFHCGDDAVAVLQEMRLHGHADARIRPTRSRKPNTSVAIATE
jgi:hypothetical protein